MLKFYLLGLLIPYVSGSCSHAFHISISEIEYNSDKERIEVVQTIFIDDLEDALKKWSGEKVDLLNPVDMAELVAMIGRYLQDKFDLSVNGQLLAMDYLGAEIDGDVMYCYSSFPFNEKPVKVKVNNSILTQLFTDQSNIIHITVGKETKNLNLNSENSSGIVAF
jgi:hypothetical protein